MQTNEELENEVEAINSIYGDGTLLLDTTDIYILNLPDQAGSFRLNFPENYPDAPPAILGTQSSGEHKGDASRLLQTFLDTVGRLFIPGEVCLFTVIEEIINGIQSRPDTTLPKSPKETTVEHQSTEKSNTTSLGPEPPWILSDVITEKKSVFIARVVKVSSVPEAEGFLRHLLATDKKVAKATHSITAWRIKGENDISFQDCDDDGETAAGGRLLHLMQLMDVWNVMVVVTRWYGGIQLGPDRFRIINSVARDAFIKGNFFQEQSSHTSKKKGKK